MTLTAKSFGLTVFAFSALLAGCGEPAAPSKIGNGEPGARMGSDMMATPVMVPEDAPPILMVMEIEGKGKIVMELEPNKAAKTTNQIVKLANDGFYDGQRIHRVEDWVVQWGDPQSKQDNWRDLRVGSQGSGNQLPYEQTNIPMTRGVIAMASTGPRVGGDSQIFILTQDGRWLEGNYTSFGRVKEGMDVVDKMQIGDRIVSFKPHVPDKDDDGIGEAEED